MKLTSRACWVILTGEYPPTLGGVADYTRQVANGLAQVGDEVHVWAPRPCQSESNVFVHSLPDNFGPMSIHILENELQHLNSDFILLVQYVPHAFGWKAMNVLFCLWLAYRSKKNKVWVVFHEVSLPKLSRETRKYWLLRTAHKVMALLLVRYAKRIFVTVPGWQDLLAKITGANISAVYLPVPSNLPVTVDAEKVRTIREELTQTKEKSIFGYFGNCPSDIEKRLGPVLLDLLQHSDEFMTLLIGPGSYKIRDSVVSVREDFSDRIVSKGRLSAQDAAEFLSACDVLLYPFSDGVSGRRTSLMACLALGLPIVGTAGELTESYWKESEAILLVEPYSPKSMATAASQLALNQTMRTILQARAKTMYNERFALHRTVVRLKELCELS